MRKSLLAASLCALTSAAAIPLASQPGNYLKGDYVEARTASVFAGACHYNSEYMTTGRDAVMAWNIASGQWNGVNLSGVRAMAIVSSDSNLADDAFAHKSQIVIDGAATTAQADAAAAAIEAQAGKSLGTVVGVRRAKIEFSHVARHYAASAAGVASLAVDGMPNDECCSQPGNVWYSPLVPLIGAKVGFTETAASTSEAISDCWSRADENGAFYGGFEFSGKVGTAEVASR